MLVNALPWSGFSANGAVTFVKNIKQRPFLIGDGVEVLSYIPNDTNLAMFDIQGENVFNLPESSPVVKGVRETLTKIGVL